MLLLAGSAAPKDAAVRRATRAAARAHLRRAVELGSRDVLTAAYATGIPEDGGDDAVFSDNPAVAEAMRRGEAAFSAGDMRTALAEYQRALALDPTEYSAALFSGDTYMKTNVDSAYVWYARATAIDPDRETAWRFWSNVLRRSGRFDAAREKAIEAIIAEPYTRMSRQALADWAQATRSSVWIPTIRLPGVDSTGPGSPVRAAYDSVRAAWKGSGTTITPHFARAYPAEPAYRRSLGEELDALRAAARAGGDAPGTAHLHVMDKAGVLEAFVLFARADAGIARDYAAYRQSNRNRLRQFWAEFVVGGKYR